MWFFADSHKFFSKNDNAIVRIYDPETGVCRREALITARRTYNVYGYHVKGKMSICVKHVPDTYEVSRGITSPTKLKMPLNSSLRFYGDGEFGIKVDSNGVSIEEHILGAFTAKSNTYAGIVLDGEFIYIKVSNSEVLRFKLSNELRLKLSKLAIMGYDHNLFDTDRYIMYTVGEGGF